MSRAADVARRLVEMVGSRAEAEADVTIGTSE